MNGDLSLARILDEWRHLPLLIGGCARSYHGLESEVSQGDYDFVVSVEDLQALRARYPDAYSVGNFGDPRITIGNVEFYAAFGGMPYSLLAEGAIEQGDHCVVSEARLLWTELTAWIYEPNIEKRRRDADLVLSHLKALR